MADKASALAGARVVGRRYLRTKRQENPDGRMPLMDHLHELRNRVVKIALAIIVGASVSWVFFDRIWAFM
jgi:sec-independent protein translocase protein TatC